MHPFVLLPLLSGCAAAALAGAILVRDPRHRPNRLVAALLACAAYWSLLEVVWNTQSDPRLVSWLIRISSLGWVTLGPLTLHLAVELSRPARPGLRRLLPVVYGAAVAGIALYIATPWCIAEAVPTRWGWGYRFGPAYWFVYTPTASCVAAALALLWTRIHPRGASASDRRQGYLALAGFAIPLFTASITDVLLPSLGIQAPRLGSTTTTIIGGVVAWSVHRYGYSLLAPGVFARDILNTMRDGVGLLNPDGRIRVANSGLARLAGCAVDDLLGRRLAELIPELPDLTQEVSDHECQLTPRRSPKVAVSVSSSRLHDKQGSLLGLVVAVHDLREIVALRRRLVMSGRLAAVGELAAGIAHEINNPLAFVQANLNQLRQRWSALGGNDGGGGRTDEILEEGEELIEESLEGVERVAAIVRDIRGFSHGGQRAREDADLNGLLETVLRMAASQLRYRVTLQRDYGDLPPVPCNPQELKQVFLNLVMNAAHAIGSRGTIRIETRCENGCAAVRIADDGCGISRDVIDRIFDPFFTTKSVGEGTGLGLAISYHMVRNHGGDIRVESQDGIGTSFCVRLPLDQPGGADESGEPPSTGPRGDALDRSVA